MIKASRIQCLSHVAKEEWDKLAANFGGGFFHSHAHATHSTHCFKSEPLFVKAVDDDNACFGMAVSNISSAKFWPFSAKCKQATFEALPITRDNDIQTQQAILEKIGSRIS